jgi:hypothetical protein
MVAAMEPKTRRPRTLPALLVPLLLLVAWLTVAPAGPAAAAGPGSITGVVRTDLGTAVAGARLAIQGPTNAAAVTDSSGAFSVSGLLTGDYTVRVRTLCLTPVSTSVRVNGAETPPPIVFSSVAVFDAFGHTCHRETTSFALHSGTSKIALSGDDEVTTVALPFGFPFYGTTKTSVNITTNGYLSFGTPNSNPTDLALSDPLTEPDAIYALWNDLEVDASASVRTSTVGSAPHRAFVVQWNNVKIHGDVSGQRFSFEAILSEDGRVESGWFGVGATGERAGGATIGVKGANAAAGAVEVAHQDAVARDGVAIEYIVNHAPVAKAGPDQTVASGATITLDGSASTDPDGTSGLAFQWAQVAGTATVIQDDKSSKATVSGQTGPKTLTYRLTVRDPFGRTSSDDVTVTVKDPGSK